VSPPFCPTAADDQLFSELHGWRSQEIVCSGSVTVSRPSDPLVPPPVPPTGLELDPGGPKAAHLLRELAAALERGGVEPLAIVTFHGLAGAAYAGLVDAVSTVTGLHNLAGVLVGKRGDHGVFVMELAEC
jgi:hypothetical protein